MTEVAEGVGPVPAGPSVTLLAAPTTAPPTAPVAASAGPGTAGRGVRRGAPAPVAVIGFSLLACQLAAMLVFSTVQYQRFALTRDFANYAQAWWAIGHGQLNPTSSQFGIAFWRNNAEFAMWPLALLSHVFPQPLTLLWVQDVAVVVTEWVTLRWATEVVAGHRPGLPPAVGRWMPVGVAAVLALDPWAYETTAFDFHFEALTALFAVLVGRGLWRRRDRRWWGWVPATLVCSALGGVYLVGVGLSGVLAGRRTRAPGAVLAAVGLAYVALLDRLGALGVGGFSLGNAFGYLVGPHRGHVGPAAVALGALTHPGAVAHMVGAHGAVVFGFLVAGGVVGVVSPWGAGMAAVVFGPELLDSTGAFVRYAASFQSWPAIPFVVVGSVMVVVWLVERRARARRLVTAALVGAGALGAPLFGSYALGNLPGLAHQWLAVDPPAAAALARAQALIPAGAEVIASQGVVGRFAERDALYAKLTAGATLPVVRPEVVFVLSATQGVCDGPAYGDAAAIGFVRHRLHATALVARAGVSVLAWSPPPGDSSVTLP
ncbi:MAG TPA: DUF2079 domain-containing protein [Acidimicrobiales bacterium]|nr:DUF2079 domain-containing protein [Acidimicrobiales bacterium]